MSMQEAISSVFSKYATFSGRARRSEYWYFVLFNMLVSFVLGLLGGMTGKESNIFTAAASLYTLAVFVPNLAVICRRLHDTGRSGGWFFIVFVPLVGWIFLLVFLSTDGQRGPNQYGPDPKGGWNAGNPYDNNPYGSSSDQRPPWEY